MKLQICQKSRKRLSCARLNKHLCKLIYLIREVWKATLRVNTLITPSLSKWLVHAQKSSRLIIVNSSRTSNVWFTSFYFLHLASRKTPRDTYPSLIFILSTWQVRDHEKPSCQRYVIILIKNFSILKNVLISKVVWKI